MAPPDPFRGIFDEAKADFARDLAGSKLDLHKDVLSTTSIDQVYDTIEKLQRDHAKQGRNRNLNRIAPFLESLRSYVEAVDVFVQVKPELLALVWGPVKLLLLWTTNAKQALDAVLDTAAAIGALLPQFERVKAIFRDDHRLKSIMGLFFKGVFDFYSIALRFFSRSRWEVFFDSLWPRCKEKIKEVEKLLEKHAQLLRDEVTFEHIRREYESRDKVLAAFRRQEERELQQSFGILQAAVAPRFYHDKLDWLRNRTCRDTAGWLAAEPAFKKWLNPVAAAAAVVVAAAAVSPEESQCLWLHGIPGSGKTFLASWVIDRARDTSQSHTLYVFCTHLHADTTALSVIHSLLFQLASEDENLKALLVGSSRRDLESNTKAAADVLKTAVQAAAGPVFVVIDGLDEVDEFERRQVLHYVLEIAKACPSARLCISSRTDDGIERMIGDRAGRIRVDGKNFKSIQSYVQWRFEDWMRECGFLPELEKEIGELIYPVAARANGMFLYARIVLDNVKLLSDPEEIRSELRALPRDLDAAYGRIFSKLNNLRDVDKRKARRILGWIACAPTPMTMLELDQALLVRRDADGIPVIPVVRGVTPVAKLCGPIVEVVDNTPQFVHFTVKEYICSCDVENYIRLPEYANQLLDTCCTYLCSEICNGGEELQKDDDDDDDDDDATTSAIVAGKFRFLGFASSNWFPLVMASLRLSHDKAHLETLAGLVQELAGERRNKDYAVSEEKLQDPGFKLLLDSWPTACQFLAQAFSFYKHPRQEDWTIYNCREWARHDPLVVSQLHARVDQLRIRMVCRNSVNHEKNCCCAALMSHYRERVYPCTFLSCPFRRIAFVSYRDFDDHRKHHGRPHKCLYAGCEHAQIGFLTRAALRVHLEKCPRKAEAGVGHAWTAAIPTTGNVDDLYPLLLNMIKAEDVNGVREIVSACDDKKIWVHDRLRVELLKAAISVGSLPISRILFRGVETRHDLDNSEAVLRSAIASENAELLRLFLSAALRNRFRLRDGYGSVVAMVMKSRSLEASSAWKETVLRPTRHRKDHRVIDGLVSSQALTAAEQNPIQETALLQTWRELIARDRLRRKTLGNLLVRIGQSSCSIRQAAVLLEDAGVPVNFRMRTLHNQSKTVRGGLTSLHRAARKTGEKAAHFMKYLLLQGADPTLGYKGVCPGDEVGARQIQRWLGKTWYDLVRWAAEERGTTQSEESGDGESREEEDDATEGNRDERRRKRRKLLHKDRKPSRMDWMSASSEEWTPLSNEGSDFEDQDY